VAQAAERGSAGSTTLVLQTLVVPLALAEAASKMVVRGGTHVEWSPPFDDFANAYLPALRKVGYGGRLKKTTIVALARKLVVALWKYYP
jgi:RNA 3'-terminal phosphate cyclase (ATP)